MKHVYILTILVGVAGYLLALDVAREWGDSWGDLQWAVLGVVLPMMVLVVARSWMRLTQGEE